jgi:hypothetical protein
LLLGPRSTPGTRRCADRASTDEPSVRPPSAGCAPASVLGAPASGWPVDPGGAIRTRSAAPPPVSPHVARSQDTVLTAPSDSAPRPRSNRSTPRTNSASRRSMRRPMQTSSSPSSCAPTPSTSSLAKRATAPESSDSGVHGACNTREIVPEQMFAEQRLRMRNWLADKEDWACSVRQLLFSHHTDAGVTSTSNLAHTHIPDHPCVACDNVADRRTAHAGRAGSARIAHTGARTLAAQRPPTPRAMHPPTPPPHRRRRHRRRTAEVQRASAAGGARNSRRRASRPRSRRWNCAG